MEKEGYKLKFFSTAKRRFEPAWVEQYNAIEIAEKGTQLYFVTVTPVGMEVEIENADRIKSPAESLSSLEKALNLSIAKEEQTDKEIDQLAVAQLNTLKEAKLSLTDNFEYSKVVLNTSDLADGALMLLEVCVPKSDTQNVH